MSFEDSFSRKAGDSGKLSMGISDSEILVPKFKGEIEDTIIDVTTGKRTKLPIGYNIVVDEASVLIASLMKRDPNHEGILFWEVGSGDDSWSDSNPPSPNKSDTFLTRPFERKEINPEDIEFVDENNNIIEEPTNRIQITVRFSTSEGNGYLREFGLFGGAGASKEEMGSGLMINRKNHGVIYKTPGMELERILRLSF